MQCYVIVEGSAHQFYGSDGMPSSFCGPSTLGAGDCNESTDGRTLKKKCHLKACSHDSVPCMSRKMLLTSRASESIARLMNFRKFGELLLQSYGVTLNKLLNLSGPHFARLFHERQVVS